MAKNESKQEMVVRLVKDGLYTRQEIKDKVDCTAGALASYLNAMRNAAKFSGTALCPIEVENEKGEKVFVVRTFEEAEALRAERSPAARISKKSPQQQYAEAEKRAKKSQDVHTRMAERLAESKNVTATQKLRLEIARLTAELHRLEFSEMEDPGPADDTPVDADVEDAPENDESDLM